jgi:hypothetical protein
MDSLANVMIEIRAISQKGGLPGVSRDDHGVLKAPMTTAILQAGSPKTQRSVQ